MPELPLAEGCQPLYLALNMKREVVLGFVSILFVSGIAVAEDRGLRMTSAEKAGLGQYSASNLYALVIGIDHYTHWRPLRCAVNDASSVADVLTRHYGFRVQILKDADATREKIIKTVDSYSDLGPADCLVVYFAGHGWLDKDKRGYWIPVDARQNEVADYVPNSQLVHDYFGKYKVKHLLVISDSCFSGALLRGAEEVRSADWQMPTAFAKPSRWIITSGDLNPVPDGTGEHSPFANRILQYLQFEKPSFGVRDLYEYVRKNIGQGSDPIAEPLRTDTHMPGGEFIFCRLDKPVIDAGTATTTDGVRKPEPFVRKGTLVVRSPVSGKISLDDGKLWPIGGNEPLQWDDLREGSHTVRVISEDNQVWTGNPQIRANETTTTTARFYTDRVNRESSQEENERWFHLTPRLGVSPYTGVVGVDFEFGHCAVSLGLIPPMGISTGLKYFFCPNKSSSFVGIGGFGQLKEERESVGDPSWNGDTTASWQGVWFASCDRTERTIVLCPMYGHRWRSQRDWDMTLGIGIAYWKKTVSWDRPSYGDRGATSLDLYERDQFLSARTGSDEESKIIPMGEITFAYSF